MRTRYCRNKMRGGDQTDYCYTEELWFCVDDDPAALTGLKYGCAMASLAVSRS